MNSVEQVTETAKDTVSSAGSAARTAMFDFAAQVMKLVKNARETESRGVDSILDMIGLQRRESAVMPVVWFTAGAVAAGAAVMLFAPTTGKELRGRIATFVSKSLDDGLAKAKEIGQTVQSTVATKGNELKEKGTEIKDDASHKASRVAEMATGPASSLPNGSAGSSMRR